MQFISKNISPMVVHAEEITGYVVDFQADRATITLKTRSTLGDGLMRPLSILGDKSISSAIIGCLYVFNGYGAEEILTYDELKAKYAPIAAEPSIPTINFTADREYSKAVLTQPESVKGTTVEDDPFVNKPLKMAILAYQRARRAHRRSSSNMEASIHRGNECAEKNREAKAIYDDIEKAFKILMVPDGLPEDMIAWAQKRVEDYLDGGK